MKVTIENLAAHGGFVSRKPEEKDIKWMHDGQEFTATVNVLPLSYATAKSDLQALHAQGDIMAARIAHCIVGDDGAPLFTVEDVIGTASEERGPLSSELTNELMRVIAEVSGLGKRLASSTMKKRSGTSSSSRVSAAGRSKRPKSASATPST